MSPEEGELADLTGRRIGDYEMVARIGIGGMGVVYEGKHPLIGKRVAVKFLLPSLSKDKELVARFVAEARAVNAIGHRGIVDIFNFGTMEDGTQYFVMEFLEGRAFDRVIAKEAPMHPALALRYLEEILDALNAAHQAGVIHRDIKPSNIFLVESARARPYVKLLDFGIAKTGAPKTGSTPQTRQSVVIGTPEYIAPEQAQGRAISAATDLYAIGCMAFEMLTGKLPFRGENPLDTMFKHVVEPTPHAKALSPQVPDALDDLVWKLMQKRPEDRPSSCDAVLQSLETLRGAMTIDASQAFASRPLKSVSGPEPIILDKTVPSRPLPQVQVPSSSAQLAAVKRSRVPFVVIGVAGLAALALTAYAVTRPSTGGGGDVVTPPPPPREAIKPLELADAAVAVVAVPDKLPPGVDAVPDAGAKAPPPVAIKRGISAAQLKGRIAQLERKLEQREAQRGEGLPVLRSFLKQAKDDASKANSDADRKEVWLFLDDVARQIDR